MEAVVYIRLDARVDMAVVEFAIENEEDLVYQITTEPSVSHFHGGDAAMCSYHH